MITLWELQGKGGRRYSLFSWRTRMSLRHKGLEFETQPVCLIDKEAIAFSGGKTVPIIKDGESVVRDSWKIAEYLEKGAKFDVLKTREGYYRNWDHQLMQEMYTIRFKPAAEVKDRWDLFTVSAPVPEAKQSLEVIAPTREENNCTMPA